ncbi:MAG: zinc ribbon domain-containing protein [Candidatus Peregrinibacteria bacterium]
MSKVDMVNHFNCYADGLIGQDIQNAIVDVHTSYSNKFEQIKKKSVFRVTDIKPKFYKKNGKSRKSGQPLFRKGDFKEWDIKAKSTRLAKVLSFLAKYGNWVTDDSAVTIIGSLEEVLRGVLEEKDRKQAEDKLAFYKDLLFYCDKFSFWRLFSIALLKRKNAFKKYNQQPIEFKSLSFRTTSRIKEDIVGYNKNYNSEIKAFATIGGFAKDEQANKSGRTETFKIAFPIKYSKKHHGKMSDYLGDDVSYIMCIEGKRLRIILAKEGIRQVPIGGEECMGVDTNIKHNMFALKDGETIDYDRDILDGYVNFLRHLDEVQARKAKAGLPKKEISTLSSKNLKQKNAWEEKFLCDIKKKCRMLVDLAIRKGKNHIGMEDLKLICRSFTESDEYKDVKYSRLWRMLRLSSLKTIVRSIAYKQGVCVSFVHPHFTSQECDCGHISRNNRKTQEEFICEKCGTEENADSHSAGTIEKRLSEDVLRDRLLIKNKIGEYEPRRLSKDVIKSILLSHSTNRVKSVMKRSSDVITCPNFL